MQIIFYLGEGRFASSIMENTWIDIQDISGQVGAWHKEQLVEFVGMGGR